MQWKSASSISQWICCEAMWLLAGLHFSCIRKGNSSNSTVSFWNWRKTEKRIRAKWVGLVYFSFTYVWINTFGRNIISNCTILIYRYQVYNLLAISFKELTCISIKRVCTSTMFEFISNCGGLLGLFMGVSVLSIIELIYHFTLRMGGKLRSSGIVPANAQTWATHARNPHAQRRLTL